MSATFFPLGFADPLLLTDDELRQSVKTARAWARRNPVMASTKDNTHAIDFDRLMAEYRQRTQSTREFNPGLPATARTTIDLAVRTLGDLLRTGDLNPDGTSYGVVEDLMTDLRGLLDAS